jgi:phenylalanyl-tRNA synthetase beta chain
MKISYKWLSQYIDIDLSPEELQNRMTFAGLEVEGVEKLGEDLNQYIVAEIKQLVFQLVILK